MIFLSFLRECLYTLFMLKDLNISSEVPAELKAVNKLLTEEVKALTLKVEQLQH
ncbi:hypothetical protein PsAD2_02624 [Pseudovibrio axinellae]|uniref:Uncharacterized protein n=1 Tax=Pseudovibrio axinellae TaxID=989403 RepID=A0A165Y3G8_9HYPH|nr:hypothetical protein PsAD2_02624 [Pseudovibrio axinellae]SER70232.1 hypothetical protein SAMN05421798_11718 [Pseudovibrio axinellae]